MSQTRRLLGATLLAAGVLAAAPVSAQDAAVPPDAVDPGPAQPLVYQLGQTTLEAARAYWSSNGMTVLGAGHLALGTGSGLDGMGKVSAERVLLVDVAGVDFEGVTTARFGFFDNRLYRIQASLGSFAPKSAKPPSYSEADLKALGAKLRAKYGKPTEERRTLLADKNAGNDVLIWKLPQGTLTLSANVLNGSLILSDAKAEADIRVYVKAFCKTVNTPGHITCW